MIDSFLFNHNYVLIDENVYMNIKSETVDMLLAGFADVK